MHEYSAEFDAAWAIYPRRSPDNPKWPAYKAWRARLREGVTAEELTAAVREYASSVRARRIEGTERVMQGQTFFGPNERWKEYRAKPVVSLPRSATVTRTVSAFDDAVNPEEGKAFVRDLMRELAAAVSRKNARP